jgi:hypothetical protein
MENREKNELEKIDSPVIRDLNAKEGVLNDEALDSVAGGMVDGGYDTPYLTDTQHSEVAHNDQPHTE